MSRIEDVQPSPRPRRARPAASPHMLVVPAHQLRGDLVRAGSASASSRAAWTARREALTHLDRHTRFLREPLRPLAEVCLLFHLDQEFADYIAAKEFVVRGATHRQAALRRDDFDTVALCP